MKRHFALLLSGLALTTLSLTEPFPSLVGRWQKRLPDGSVGLGVFRADSTHSSFVNGKQFTSGKYYIRQDTLYVQDDACGPYYGTYKVTFVTADSIRFSTIQDWCHGRRQGSDGLTVGRVRPGQTR